MAASLLGEGGGGWCEGEAWKMGRDENRFPGDEGDGKGLMVWVPKKPGNSERVTPLLHSVLLAL
jgi:hypothetical protein